MKRRPARALHSAVDDLAKPRNGPRKGGDPLRSTSRLWRASQQQGTTASMWQCQAIHGRGTSATWQSDAMQSGRGGRAHHGSPITGTEPPQITARRPPRLNRLSGKTRKGKKGMTFKSNPQLSERTRKPGNGTQRLKRTHGRPGKARNKKEGHCRPHAE
jgi:hypothetical protein